MVGAGAVGERVLAETINLGFLEGGGIIVAIFSTVAQRRRRVTHTSYKGSKERDKDGLGNG